MIPQDGSSAPSNVYMRIALDAATILSLVIGIPLGSLASFIAWWIVAHRIRPSLRFSSKISKTASRRNPQGFVYRVKFINSGRRGILDLEISCLLYLKISDPQITTVVNIGLSRNRIPYLSRTSKPQLLHLRLFETLKLGNAPFPAQIREKFRDGTLELEELFRLDPEAKMVVLVFGYDEFSGSRQLMRSGFYRINDIVPHKFIPGSVEIAWTDERLEQNLPIETSALEDEIQSLPRTRNRSRTTSE